MPEYFLDTIIPIFFTLVGAAITLYALWQIRRGAASKNWPTSAGTITSSGVSTKESTDWEDGDDDHNVEPTTVVKFTPQVIYEYQVEGVAFTGDKIALYGSETGNRNDAREIADRYPVGTLVTVYYDPGKPQYSLLETGGHWLSYLFVLLGIVLMAMALMFANYMPSWLGDV